MLVEVYEEMDPEYEDRLARQEKESEDLGDFEVKLSPHLFPSKEEMEEHEEQASIVRIIRKIHEPFQPDIRNIPADITRLINKFNRDGLGDRFKQFVPKAKYETKRQTLRGVDEGIVKNKPSAIDEFLLAPAIFFYATAVLRPEATLKEIIGAGHGKDDEIGTKNTAIASEAFFDCHDRRLRGASMLGRLKMGEDLSQEDLGDVLVQGQARASQEYNLARRLTDNTSLESNISYGDLFFNAGWELLEHVFDSLKEPVSIIKDTAQSVMDDYQGSLELRGMVLQQIAEMGLYFSKATYLLGKESEIKGLEDLRLLSYHIGEFAQSFGYCLNLGEDHELGMPSSVIHTNREASRQIIRERMEHAVGEHLGPVALIIGDNKYLRTLREYFVAYTHTLIPERLDPENPEYHDQYLSLDSPKVFPSVREVLEGT